MEFAAVWNRRTCQVCPPSTLYKRNNFVLLTIFENKDRELLLAMRKLGIQSYGDIRAIEHRFATYIGVASGI